MKKLAELTVKLLHAIALAVECGANLYHAVRMGLSALISTVKEQMKQNKK
jgi:hypothetical protein